MYFFLSTDCISEERGFYDTNTLLSASYTTLDGKYNTILSKSFILKPEGKLTKDTRKIIKSFNKVDETKFEYINKIELLKIIEYDLKSSKYLIANYNKHHRSLINSLSETYNDFFFNLTDIDILQISRSFAGIKMYKGNGNLLKTPSSIEVYYWLFKKKPKIINSHFTIGNLIECFTELNNRGLIPELHPSIDFTEELIKSKLKSY